MPHPCRTNCLFLTTRACDSRHELSCDSPVIVNSVIRCCAMRWPPFESTLEKPESLPTKRRRLATPLVNLSALAAMLWWGVAPAVSPVPPLASSPTTSSPAPPADSLSARMLATVNSTLGGLVADRRSSFAGAVFIDDGRLAFSLAVRRRRPGGAAALFGRFDVCRFEFRGEVAHCRIDRAVDRRRRDRQRG